MAVQLGSAYGQIILDASGVRTGVGQAQGALGGLQGALTGVGESLTKKVTLPLVGVGIAAGKVAGDFESQMATLSIAARSSGTSLETLREAALKTGADTSLVGISAAESAEAIENLYKAGMNTADIFGDLNGYMDDTAELSGALRASIDLQAASELNLADASEVVAISMATFGLNADDAVAIVDNFVQSADASVTSVGELAAAMVNVGPTAAAFGWSLEDTNTALAILSERGIRGSEAGTALKSMMTNMMRPTDDVVESLQELGVALYDSEGRMRSLPAILADFEAGLAGVTEEQRNQYVQTITGTYGMKAMNTLLAEGSAGWGEMEGAIASAATAQDVASARTDTFQGSMEALQGSLETLLIQVGTPLINDFLRPAADWLSEVVGWFTSLSPEVQKAAVTFGLLAAGMGPAMRIGAGMIGTFSQVAGGARMMATGLMAAPGLLRDVGAGFQLLWGSGIQGAFGVASSGAAGLTATMIPLAAAVGAVVATYVAWRNVQDKVSEGQEKVNNALSSWSEEAAAMIAGGASSAETVGTFTARLNEATAAMDKGGIASDLFVDELGIINQTLGEIEGVARGTSETYAEYTARLEEHNATVTDHRSKIISLAEAQEMATRLLQEDLTVGTQAAAMERVRADHVIALTEAEFNRRKVLEELVSLEAGYYSDQAEIAAAMERRAEIMTSSAESSDQAMLNLARNFTLVAGSARDAGEMAERMAESAELSDQSMLKLATGYTLVAGTAKDAGGEVESLADAVEAAVGPAMEMSDIMSNAEEALSAVGLEGDALDARMAALAVSLGTVSVEEAKLQQDVETVTAAFAEGVLSTEDYVSYMNQAANGALNLSAAQQEGISSATAHARAQREAAEALAEMLDMNDILGVTKDAFAAAGWEGEALGNRMTDLGVRLGAVSAEGLKLQQDVDLVATAFAEGSLSTEAFVDYMGQAEAGTLNLSNAQRAGISSAMEHARAQREAAAASDAYRLALLAQSEALMDATAQQAAQIALQGLSEKFEAGLISLDQYEAATISVQDAYGLATPQSRALAEAITVLNDGLAAGKYAPEEYAAAVEAARAAAEGGESTVRGLMAAVEEAVEPMGEGQEAVASYGGAADTAAGQVDSLADSVARATGELESMTSKKWVVEVGTSGTLPPGVSPVAMAVGAWNIPQDMLALVHQGEMVIPADEAEMLRSLITATPAPVFPSPSVTEPGPITNDYRSYPAVNVYVDRVGDEVDVEMLAYRVAYKIQEQVRR